MKYAFFGSPQFARIILEKLIASKHLPCMLVCNPDKPVGRKRQITAPQTKILAQQHPFITIQQPRSKEEVLSLINNPTFKECEYAIVAAYARIIPKTILEIFKKGVIGVHPSLLPKHRGAAPIQQTILDGDATTGVTLYLMDELMDHGPIYKQEELKKDISKATYWSLMEDLAELSAQMLLQALPSIEGGAIKTIPQDNTKTTITKKFETQDGFVDLEKDSPTMIDRKIRALNPDPGVYTIILRKRVKLLSGKINSDGSYTITKIIPEGKRERRSSIIVPSR